MCICVGMCGCMCIMYVCGVVCVLYIPLLFLGQPEVFILNFKAAENFLLDVYFLLDLTGSFSVTFRDTVTPLAADLCMYDASCMFV